MAVLDAPYAGSNRPLDRGRRVGVNGDVGAPVLGGFNGGTQLRLGERDRVEWTVRRRDPSTRRQFDLRCAEHELLPHAQANLIWTVRDHAAPDHFHARSRVAEAARELESLAEVAMAAGYGDDSAGRIDARAGDQALVNGPLEPERGAAHIANSVGCERRR